MDLPPPTYGLLLGATLLALPFLVRGARGPPQARLARSVLFSLALLELALILLYYSKLVCWVLAGAAATALALQAWPLNRRVAAALMVPFALFWGLLFQFLPGEGGFVAYFGVGLPLLLGLPLAGLVARWARWDTRPRTLAAYVLILGLAGLFSWSAFALNFLQLFEVAHLPILLLSLAGFAWLLGRGGDAARAERDQALTAMNPAEYAAAEAAPTRIWIPSLASFLAAATGLLILLQSSLEGLAIALAALLLHVQGLIACIIRGPTWGRVAGTSLQLFASLLIPIPAVFEHYLAGGASSPRPYLVFAAAATTLALLALTLALAESAHASRRARALRQTPILPRTFLQWSLPQAPTVPQLKSFANEVRQHGSRGGLIHLPAPADPLWTLPDAIYEWLQSQPSGPRLHLRVPEAAHAFDVPPIWPEEAEP